MIEKYGLRGFSLLELLIVLLIIGLLSAISLPAYQTLFAKNESEMIRVQLLKTIYLAQSLARTQHVTAMICKSKDHLHCGGAWIDGYILFADDKLILRFQNFIKKGQLNWRARGHESALVIYPTGETHRENGTFWFCQENEKNPAWAIVLNKKMHLSLKEPDKEGKIMVGHSYLNC